MITKNSMPEPQRTFEFERLYTQRARHEVRSFVEKNRFLAPLLS